MYFPLEINEHLANAMKAVVTAKTEIGIFGKKEKMIKEKRVSLELVNELDEILCDAITRIASISGCVMADDVVTESCKKITNYLNAENHVSK